MILGTIGLAVGIPLGFAGIILVAGTLFGLWLTSSGGWKKFTPSGSSSNRISGHNLDVLIEKCNPSNVVKCIQDPAFIDEIVNMCNDVEIGDITYKLLHINLEQAVLRETLRFPRATNMFYTNYLNNSKL